MSARARIVSLAKDADRAIARLVLAMADAGMDEPGTNVIDGCRTQLAFWTSRVLDLDLPSATAGRQRQGKNSNVINIVPLLRNRRELAAVRRAQP